MGKDIIGFCFQCGQEDIIINNEDVCPNCDRMNRENDYKNGEIGITKDNIHLYYEFMSDEGKKEYISLMTDYMLDNHKKGACVKIECSISPWSKEKIITTGYICDYYGSGLLPNCIRVSLKNDKVMTVWISKEDIKEYIYPLYIDADKEYQKEDKAYKEYVERNSTSNK